MRQSTVPKKALEIDAFDKKSRKSEELHVPSQYSTYSEVPHFLSNVFGCGQLIAKLDSDSRRPSVPDGRTPAAVILGESFFPSFLKVLSEPLVIFVDIDQRVLDYNRYVLQCFLDSNSRDKFLEKLLDESNNPILKSKIRMKSMEIVFGDARLITKNASHQVIDREFISTQLDQLKLPSMLGEQSFLFSETAFLRARSAAMDKSFAFVNIDLLNRSQIIALQEVLEEQQCAITTLNINNLVEYDGEKFPLRESHKHKEIWRPSGRLLDNLKILLGKYVTETHILFAALSKKNDILIAGEAKSLQFYANYVEEYTRELSQPFALSQQQYGSSGFFKESDLLQQYKAENPGQALRRAASGFGSLDGLRQLLDKFPQYLNAQDDNEEKRYTPLHCAIRNTEDQHKDRSERVCLLLKTGANAYLPDAKGETPFALLEADSTSLLFDLLAQSGPLTKTGSARP